MQAPKFLLIQNMRKGGNFVCKLADAMEAADPVNYQILVNAFPFIVNKYSDFRSKFYSANPE